MRRRVGSLTGSAILASGLIALMLSGCADDSALVTQATSTGHILMTDARHVEAVPGNDIEGTLVLVGDCFGLHTSAGDFAAVFPQGSGLIEDTDQVEIPGWGTLGLDNHYQGGGGVLASSTLSYHDDIPTACRGSRIVVLDPIR
ncbi:MAG: hypothetical protein KF801_07780 [Cryobacterium sp.]|jgi:hypothetical protein|nr:hypothetical protein [Cryobacterium sp.]